MNRSTAITELKEAQDMIYQAIDAIEEVEKDFPNSQVKHYVIPYLKIRAGHSDFLTNDFNIDQYIESLDVSRNDMIDAILEFIEEDETDKLSIEILERIHDTGEDGHELDDSSFKGIEKDELIEVYDAVRSVSGK